MADTTKPQPDLEAAPPKVEETASVAGTADDSSVGMDQEHGTSISSSTTRSKKGLLFYGALLGTVGVVALLLVLTVGCSNKDKDMTTQSMEWLDDSPVSELGNNNKPPCPNKTKEVDMGEEPVEMQEVLHNNNEPPALELPTTLPFADLPTVQSFSSDVLEGYQTVEDLQADLTVATKHVLNRIILQNAYDSYYYAQQVWLQAPSSTARERPSVQQQVAQQAAATTTTASATKAKAKTNTQEEDADEADHVKTDEEYVYASYGDYLVVWDRQGNQVTTVQMPSQSTNDDEATDDDFSAWVPPTYINGLLLTPTRVVVLIDAFAIHNDQEFLHTHQGTQVRIYSKPTAPDNDNRQTMELLEVHDLNGKYLEGRWMHEAQTLHLLTSGDVNAYPHLIDPLQPHYFQEGLSPQEYAHTATLLAETKLIPEFVQGITRALEVNPQAMLRLNDWAGSAAATDSQSVEELMKGSHHFYGFDAPLASYLQVTSLDLVEDMQEETQLTHSVVLAPASNAQLYATENHLVVSLVHSVYDETTHESEETLFLMHLKDGNFYSVATLNGHTHGPFAMDIQGNDLRVATTVQLWSPLNRVWPLCEQDADFEEFQQQNNNNLNYNSCLTDESYDRCFHLVIDGCTKVEKTGCPYEYTCVEQPAAEDASSTENYVVVLDIGTPGQAMERGRVKIGEPHEVITAVRFGETFSYAMTFDQRDPFYVLDLQPEQAPSVKGSLKLDGFSRYLHPLNEEATLLVGIGQNVTGEGLDQRETGVLITVFDVTNPSEPVAVASHGLVDDPESFESYTEAEWDHKAVQYANGKLILPVTLYHHGWSEAGDDQVWFHGQNLDDFVEATTAPKDQPVHEDFEGFMVFEVGQTGIQEAFRINFLEPETLEDKCHYCNGGLLSSRSFVYEDGTLMTLHVDSVKSNNLQTGEELWKMDIELEGVSKDCCW